MNFLKIFVLAFSAVSTSAFATEKISAIAADTVVSLRAHSNTHANVTARKMQMMYAPNLQDGCTSIYLYSDNDVVLYGTLLRAVTQRLPFEIIYETDPSSRGPWGDSGSCMLTSISIKR